MSQRKSGYARQDLDAYETPAWVTEMLITHLYFTCRREPIHKIWEPAAGSGKMAEVLKKMSVPVCCTDIATGDDFLRARLGSPCADADCIVTNPPYHSAEQFIKRALDFTQWNNGVVAMLLRTDFDHAKSRTYLFGAHQTFAKKIVLTKRIKWFEDSKGQPSFNHAWFVWDWMHKGPPILAYDG